MVIETDRLLAPVEQNNNEDAFDRAIRPRALSEYVGQPAVCEQMEIFIEAARGRSEPLDHTLIFGPPGLGKTTLANIIAREMTVDLKTTSGPVLEKAGDLAALMTNLEPGDVLFIDPICSHGPPFIMIPVKPSFGDVLEVGVICNSRRIQVIMIIDDR